VENKSSVIIIDDEHDIIESMSMFLELNDIEVKGFGNNGCDAVKLFVEKKPDYVVLDINMPDYDGHYAIEKIKEQDPNAKILISTGFSDKNIKKDDVVRIFTKPFDLEELVQEIQK
jgi:DNA-binding NtrC family response regulator